ncbi:hypothetical protein AB0E11_27795 [Streptomyces fradiae]
MLRRYHPAPPDDGPDGAPPDETAGPDDAPQDDAPAGRSRTRSKRAKEG